MLPCPPGETPFQVIPGTNERMPDLTIPAADELSNFTHDQFRAAAAAYGSKWYEVCNAAVKGARAKGEEPETARILAIVRMMEAFIEQGAAAVGAPVDHASEPAAAWPTD